MLGMAAMLVLSPIAARSQDYFVPNQPRAAQPGRAPSRSAPPAQRPVQQPPDMGQQQAGGVAPGGDMDPPPAQFPRAARAGAARFAEG